MYHQIDVPPKKGTPFRGLTVDPRRFRHQMTMLKWLGYTGLSMNDLKPYLAGNKTGKVFGLTFDDGFLNVFDNALPVLTELKFTATNYFVSRQIGGSNAWDSAVGVPPVACMSIAEIRHWIALGHEVGAHTQDHVHLTDISPVEARRQITDSRKELEDLSGTAVDTFSYPYGDVSPLVRGLVEEAGYSSAVTTQRGRARSEDDRLMLPRRNVRRNETLPGLLWKSVTG